MEKKILVVDDEAIMREMATAAFTNIGYTVKSAESAEEALEILKNESFLVMYLDLNLPGMNGVDLCRQIRSDNPVAICHAITAYTSLFELADCRDAGFDDYFPKPTDLNIILKSAETAFEKLARWKVLTTDRPAPK
jgi:CheY-like chemotaxis protein